MTTTSNIVPAKPAAVNGTPLTEEGYLPPGHPAYVAFAAYLDELAAAVGTRCRSTARAACRLLERRGLLRIRRDGTGPLTLTILGAPA